MDDPKDFHDLSIKVWMKMRLLTVGDSISLISKFFKLRKTEDVAVTKPYLDKKYYELYLERYSGKFDEFLQALEQFRAGGG